ncbi:MAG: 3-phenylpropionate/cinnamic acid dioxygenase subunit beta [Gammaproteobacteria bacterium]
MSPEDHRSIELFLYLEARLLDQRRYRDWLDLLADDLQYWVPIRSTRFGNKSHAITGGKVELQGAEITRRDELAYMDDTKVTLRMRVERLETGTAWAEEPPSRTTHLITNIEVEPATNTGEFQVFSNFLMFRSRLETEEDVVVGNREDLLRRHGDGWLIARRKVVLTHNVLSAKNLSTFL